MINNTCTVQIFYEIRKTDTANKFIYQSSSSFGLAYDKKEMIDNVTRNHNYRGKTLEFVQVESLPSIRKKFRRQPDASIDVVALQPSEIRSLFYLHSRLGIPLTYTVQMVCKCLGFDIGALSVDCGYNRNYLNRTISGERKPTKKFRIKIAQKLGIDPWCYMTDSPVVVLDRDLVH